MKGKINYSYGHGQGDFVFFDLNEENGNITDYGLNTSQGEEVMFSNITFDEFLPEEIETLGSIARIIDGQNIAVIHDNPTGMFHLFVKEKESVNVTLVLAGNMTVVDQWESPGSENMTYQLNISDGVSKGMIASNDPFQVDDAGKVITCEVTEQLIIRFLPQVAHTYQWMEMLLMQVIQEGVVAAEITLVADEEGGAYDVVSYSQEMQLQVLQVIRDRFQLDAQGQNGNGALLVVHTDKATMDMSHERLRVQVNAHHIEMVANPLELIYGQSDTACYSVLDDGEVQQMLIFLPATVLGTITVEVTDVLADLFTPMGMTMVLCAVGLVALAGVVAFRRR
ncbi:MAG: hypothetical protein JXA45_02580 [Methanomassiliicoccales archaeon]|nr:hypothetical protein [Methanomassiliicoccales archaeon]